MAKPNFGKGRDGIYKAIGEGERTSKKVATIRKTDGTTFRRKNANQYGSAQGDNDYYEDRPNRSDKYGQGATVKGAKSVPPVGDKLDTSSSSGWFLLNQGASFDDKESAIEYTKTRQNKYLNQAEYDVIVTREEDGKIRVFAREKNYLPYNKPDSTRIYAKGSTVASKKKQPKIVRGFSDDEEYEYGQGGTTTGFNYSIGGL